MNNPLSNLKIDYWYKVSLIIATVLLITSLTVDLKGVKNKPIQLISVGIIIISLGEWINHPIQIQVIRPNPMLPSGGQLEGHPRKNSALGIFFDILGIIILVFGSYRLF